AATPSFGVAGGTYNTPQSVSISTTTGGATLYYTTDGTVPTTSSAVYTAPVLVDRSLTLRAIAVVAGMADSDVAAAAYTLQAATPTFNPPAGSYLLRLTVSINDASPGVTIYYTTNGSTPTPSSTQYTGPFVLLLSGTVKAIAVRNGWSQSPVATAVYTIGL